MKRLFAAFLVVFALGVVHADSPLTSTYFALVYADIPAIQHVLQPKDAAAVGLDAPSIAFLDNPAIALDQKLALINALGYGKLSNTQRFKEHLMAKYHLQQASLDSLFKSDMNTLNSSTQPALNYTATVIAQHDLLSLCYLHVMGDYFNPIAAVNTIDYLYFQQPTNQSIALVTCLIAGQLLMDYDWCAVAHCTDMLYNQHFEHDLLRKEALNKIGEYMQLYNAACSEEIYGESSQPVEPEPEIIADARVYDLSYYTYNPVYLRPLQQLAGTKKNFVDLAVLNTCNKKEAALNNWLLFNDEKNGTEMRIRVKNKGNMPSVETNLLITILKDEEMGEKRNGYFQERIPAIAPGDEQIITVVIGDYWIYDPNAHFTIELDYDQNIQEKDELNNKLEVFEWG
jgi:hypothetical protein